MAANYVLLEKITVGAAGASSVTFSSIPQTGYTDLVLKMSVRTDRASTDDLLNFNFNGVSTNQSSRNLQGNGSTASSGTYGSNLYLAWVDAASNTASTFGNAEMYIPNYTSSNFKSVSTDGVLENNATTAVMGMTAGLWSSTAAITSIAITSVFSANFVQGSTFYLYGVAKLGTTPAIVPYATGGDTIMTDGTYWYHAFKSSGTFTPAKGLSCDVLVVAGGGGGGSYDGGGGGAGGVIYFTSQTVTSATTATVGGGGAADANGSNSQFGSLTVGVGGGKGAGGGSNGFAGGSGGGASYAAGSTTGGAANQTGTGASAYYGNAGGNSGANLGGGGGGGAGAAGTAGVASYVGKPGGVGTSVYSSWGSVTGTGQNSSGTYYYAGGGGGGSLLNDNPPQAAGGLGGGGKGGVASATQTAGTANTGGGGGGGGDGADYFGRAGGSGLVIVRYAV